MSTKKKIKRRLTLELIMMTVISLICGVLAAQAVNNVAVELVLGKLNRENYYEVQVQETLDNLNRFIQEKQVTEDNIELLASWAQTEKNVYVMFYRDVDALFGPYMATDVDETEEDGYGETDYYDVTLADGMTIKAELDCYLSAHLFYVIDAACFVLGGIVFILILFALIHQKIRYINLLNRELKILGSGNLEYPMTIRGCDEITGLAWGIENLKNGILEQQLMKDEAQKANAELVTAMSHDLRTPLTSLIGYLELLTMQRYEDEGQLKNYLKYCREKAFQLKRMSDRLFEYFLVYGEREQQYHYRQMPCENLVEDLCNSQFFDWQEQGGVLECRIESLTGHILVDSDYLQRVLDNLLSNLKKYGDGEKPLQIEACEKDGMLTLCIRNHVKKQENHRESTQIGLRTCKRIIEEHRGTFEWSLEGEIFSVCLRLPLVK